MGGAEIATNITAPSRFGSAEKRLLLRFAPRLADQLHSVTVTLETLDGKIGGANIALWIAYESSERTIGAPLHHQIDAERIIAGSTTPRR